MFLFILLRCFTLISISDVHIYVNSLIKILQNNIVGDANEILKTHGPAINDILSGRADTTLAQEKERGANHAATYLEENPSAVKTESGLVFHETQAGTGEPPAEVDLWGGSSEIESLLLRCKASLRQTSRHTLTEMLCLFASAGTPVVPYDVALFSMFNFIQFVTP